MRTATVRQLRHDLNAVLAWVAAGEEVTVLKRTRPVARICPLRPTSPAEVKMPDFAAQAKAIFGKKRTHLSDLVLQERERSQW